MANSCGRKTPFSGLGFPKVTPSGKRYSAGCSAGASGSRRQRHGSSIFQRLYYSKFGFFVQAAVCPACVTKMAAPPQKTAESAVKPPFFCHAGVTKNFSALGCRPQIRMVKIAVDSGMCFVPTEHCMRRQTLPCRICPTPEPILRKCSVRAGNEIVLPSS